MTKNLHLIAAIAAGALLSFQNSSAQNTSPYWSLKGNSNATSSTYKLGTTNAYALRLTTNNTTRLYISPSAGYVGIGTTAPGSRFQINASSGTSPFKALINGATKLYMSSAGGLSVGSGSAAPTNGLYVSGNVGIGTNVPAYKLQVNGNASISSGLYVGNNGVYGYNSSGPGVYGSGSSYGVYATSTGNYGVYSSSAYYGVYASGVIGVYGAGSTYGLSGYSSSGYGLYAVNNSGNYGAVAYGGYGGVYGSGGTVGVYGTGATYGIWGYSSTKFGVYGQSGSSSGVYGYSSTGYGIEAHNNSGSWAATAYGGYGGVYGTGGVYGVYGTTSGSGALGGYFYSANYYGLRAATGRTDKNWAGVFDGNVYSFGAFQTSDKNLKKNISDFSDAMSIIDKLKPRSYEFRTDGKLAAMHLPNGKHYGLIAQDLEEVLPNLVKEVDGAIADNSKMEPKANTIDNVATSAMDPKSPMAQSIQNETQQAADQTALEKMTIKSINYIELIPIMVKGMQEQAELIRQQQLQIDDLKARISRLSGTNTVTSMGGSLGQNTPNPVNGSTRISYSVPAGAGRAQLLLTDNGGKTVKAVSLNPGSSMINLNTVGLSSGIYNYSLMVDGKIVESKKMEVVRNR